MKKFGSLLLVYYHPIIFDLAQSFSELFDVEVAVNQNLKDNYGGANDVISKGAAHGIKTILLQQALANVRLKKYDLMGCDGVFDGDKLAMNVCENNKIPWFAINGYPHNEDEPSNNILSFSWYLPQKRYRNMFPSEGHVKEVDWRDLAEGNQREKNIFVFYPEMRELKKQHWLNVKRSGGVSLIHRYEECNRWCYEIFKKVNEKVEVKNYSALNQKEVWELLVNSNFLLHAKSADCPGIAVLEGMYCGAIPIVTKNFILASHNQELLIPDYSAIVCDTAEEVVDACIKNYDKLQDPKLRHNTFSHIEMLTNFERQRPKLERFFEKCLA